MDHAEGARARRHQAHRRMVNATHLQTRIRRTARWLLAAMALGLVSGCATVPLDTALRHFHQGALDVADNDLASLKDGPDAVRQLMERGMIRHLRHDYAGSTADWARAIKLEEALETHSLSKAGGSLLINDSVLAYRGAPFERTYLHVFQSRNYLARGLWEDAGVEARNIIRLQERLNGFPDDAYSRYLAGLCLTLAGDDNSAFLQYQTASSLVSGIGINPATGQFLTSAPATNRLPRSEHDCELVCLVDLDRSDGADIYIGNRWLGSAHILSDTSALAARSREIAAARKMAKAAARIALKETLAAIVAAHNQDLGDAVRVLLFSMETPDERSWRTLPRQLAVARVPCPPDLQSFDVVFREAYGIRSRRTTITAPLVRQGHVFVSFCRDYP